MGFWGLVGFLSRLPGREESPEQMAGSLALFPVAGLLTGGVAGMLSGVEFWLLPRWVAVLAFLPTYFAVKGLLHTDGLADFADGLAAHGSPEARERIVHDPHVGVAGVIAILIFLGGVALAMWKLPSSSIPIIGCFHTFPWAVSLTITVAEICGNAAMVGVLIIADRPAPSSRLGQAFLEGRTPGKIALATIGATILALLLGGILVTGVLIALLVGFLVAHLANRSFGGIGGDALGAGHHVTFLVLIVMAAAIPWSPLL